MKFSVTKTSRSPLLDTLKGISIIFVIITHYPFSELARKKLLFPFWIDMAVPMFMLISGFLYAASYERSCIQNLKSAYQFKFLLKKIIRFTVPFLFAYFLEMAVKIFIHDFSFKNAIAMFFYGGEGPGSYYYPIMIQFLFVFPVIFFMIKENPKKGLFLCLLANFIFEFLKTVYLMNPECYRLLIFRYIFLISFGCYAYFSKEKILLRKLIASLVIGILYIIIVRYTGYKRMIINEWEGTSFLAAFYIIPIFYLMLKHAANLTIPIVSFFGKVSFNIFLVQMVWYAYGAGTIYSLMESRFLELLVNIVVCLAAGTVFSLIEGKVTKIILRGLNLL